MLELAILGSGSSGNSALVCLGETRILIDAGLSARQLCTRLDQIGVASDSISAVVLTHEHGDHTKGLDVFCRKRPLPVYASTHTCAMVREGMSAPVRWHQFEAGSGFQIGGVLIESFPVPHDAVDPVGFVFACGRSRIGLLSDVGHVTRLIVERLKGVDTLFTEANYDEMMLQNDVHRPWATKQRISNRHGHLSNDQTAELLAEIAHPGLHRVVLGHLSSDCNTSVLACEVIRNRLAAAGFPDVIVECAPRHEVLPLRPAQVAMALPAVVTEDAPPAYEAKKKSRVKRELPGSDYQQLEWGF
jgi:phosphoribosyl 1,2-cyclic phosphodiesterase